MSDLEQRISNVEKNLAIFSAGEKEAIKWQTKVDRALFGYNGESGMVDDVRFMKKVFKVVAWIFALIFAPLFGVLGFLAVKVLANIDKIMKLLDGLK